MKNLIQKIYLPVVFFLLIQDYVSSEIFWMFGMMLAVYYLIIENRLVLHLPHKEIVIILVFLLWGTVMGCAAYLLNNVRSIDVIRDIFYYMNPVIFMYIGAQYAKKKIEFHRILNSIILASGIYSGLKLLNIISNLSTLLSAYSIHSWRKIAGDGVVMMGMTLAIVLSGFISKEERLPKFLYYLVSGLTGVYFVVCLSRTYILFFIIMYMVLLINHQNSYTIIKRVSGTLVLCLVLLAAAHQFFPSDIIQSFTGKLLSSMTEISSSNSYTTAAEIQANWRGYETHSAIVQWKNLSFLQQIVGQGFGSRIYVGYYAYTLLGQTINGTAASSIAVLHNGYATQLIKLGGLGVVLYLIYYLLMIRKAARGFRYSNEKYCRMLLAIGLVFLIQTYFLNGLFKDYCFYPTVLMMGYCAYKIDQKEK